MTLDSLMEELAHSGWRLRYLQQDWAHWACMLHNGALATDRHIGKSAIEALASALEGIACASPIEPAKIYTPQPFNLRKALGLVPQDFRRRV